MEARAKGVYLKILVDGIKKEKGLQVLEQIKQKVGKLDFSSIADYPLSTEARMIHAYLEITEGKDTVQGQYEFGRLAVRSYGETFMGKTIFSLFGGDVGKVAESVGKLLNSVLVGAEAESEIIGENHARVCIHNCNALSRQHFEGVFAGAIEYLGFIPHISSVEIISGKYEYDVTWEK